MTEAQTIPFTVAQHTREEMAEKFTWATAAIAAEVRQGNERLFERLDRLFVTRNFITRQALTFAAIFALCDCLKQLEGEREA